MLIGIDANEANIPRRVGVNQYAFHLLWAMSRLQTPHQFTIYLKTPPLPDLPPSQPGWNYRVIPFPKLWTQTRLPWDLFTHFPRPDVFFTPCHYSPRWSPSPTVVTVMDLGFLSAPDQFTPKDYNQLKNWTLYSVRQAKKIIAISEFTKADIIRAYARRPSDVIITYLGYDTKLFRPIHRPSVLKKYGIHSPYYYFLSALKPSKNVEGLIKAFARLPNSGYQLVISGKKAWMYDSIFSLVKNLNLQDRVIFTGFVDESEVPVLMTESAAFVLPSFWEGFGIPVVEAMACGTPVVVSRIASLPEVAGPAGIYIDPTNIQSLARGLQTAVGSHRAKYIELGLKQVKKFSWSITATQTLKVLESAV